MLCSLQTTLIHLGAKYAPCMRWDETLSREIKESRLKERDTACCIRKDRAGCVQSPKTECTKVGGETAGAGGGSGSGGGEGGTVSMSNNSPRSNWVRQCALDRACFSAHFPFFQWRPSEWYSKYPNENLRSSGPVCGLDPA